jgi:hypothetical protein
MQYDLRAVARPQSIVGRDVKQKAHAGQRARQRLEVADVALEQLDVQPRQIVPAARRPHQRAYRIARSVSRSHYSGADKAVGTGYQHGIRSHSAGMNRENDGIDFASTSWSISD